MELQHINIKLPLEEQAIQEWNLLIPVFHSWIQNQVCEELLIDVADYRHVFSGPGVVLVGLEANYSLESNGNRRGLRYNRKSVTTGSNHDRLKQAMKATLRACLRLEEDLNLHGMIRFNRSEFQVFINDRLLAPNSRETYETVRPELDAFIQKARDGSDYTLEWNADRRSLFGVTVKSSRSIEPARMLENLG